jgi:hypothetical protein
MVAGIETPSKMCTRCGKTIYEWETHTEEDCEKERCVACNNEIFVGDVGEVQEHLCKKHLKEYRDERVKEIKDYLNSTL